MQNCDTQHNPALSGEMRVPMETVPPLKLDDRKVILRRAAMEITPKAIVNLGVGMASAVGNVANEEETSDQIMLTADPGIYGGVPMHGFGFGAALNFTATIDHATQFDFIDGGGIDIACLGFAECDQAGNINASRFANRVSGCGGFINITQNSKKVVYVGTFAQLAPHPDMEGALKQLRDAGYRTVAFSNSSLALVTSQITNSGLAPLFDEIISVEQTGSFKPDVKVYHFAAERVGRPIGDLCLVATHDWDTHGAMTAGMGAAYIDRSGAPYHPLYLRPEIYAADMGEVVRQLIAVEAG